MWKKEGSPFPSVCFRQKTTGSSNSRNGRGAADLGASPASSSAKALPFEYTSVPPV